MPKGTVLWFNSEKGYGFIQAQDTSQIFVRESSIQIDGLRTLKSGDKVSFEIDSDSDERGPQASKVVLLN
jgi:CspA family cold shock protein